MEGYKKCPNEHYYKEILTQCPYCAQNAVITEEAILLVEQWQKMLVEKSHLFSKTEINALKANLSQESSYSYVVAKAARYLISCKKSIDYARDDFFHYPMQDYWNIQQVYSACKELVYEVRGLSVNYCFIMPPTAIRELYEMFHFTFTDFENTTSKNVFKINFAHKVTGEKCYAYCRCEDMSILNRYPFYFRIEISKRLNRHDIIPENPVLVTLCEKETFVKICTENRTYGITAEYAYCYQKFPHGTERIKQWYGEKNIEGKQTKVDVLALKLPDRTEREVTFDISDFKNEF